ncbi:MAG: sensor histidine kinase [Lachnospiraceae bacterium]|nr:sensor histidine kinase [Lachnospiraceae bacterium]
MKFHIRNLKLRYQITGVFVVVFLVMSLGIGTAFYHLSAKNVTDNFSKNAESNLAQLEMVLDARLRMIDGQARTMLINNTFSTVLYRCLVDPTIKNMVTAQSIISDYLKNFEQGEYLVASSCIYSDVGNFEGYIHGLQLSAVDLDSVFADCYSRDTEKAVRWLPPMTDRIFQGEKKVIPCVRKFTVNGNLKWQYMVYQLDVHRLEGLVSGQSPFFDEIILIDAEGNQIFGPEDIQTEAFLDKWKNDGTDTDETRFSGELDDGTSAYLAEGRVIPLNQWRIIGLKSKNELLESLKELRSSIFQIAMACMLAGSVLVLWISEYITNSLSRLEKQMLCVQNGDFNVRFFYPYKDEIGTLSRSFNYMLGKIQTLILAQEENIRQLQIEKERVQEVQKQKRKAELKALQAQINPHFLYNTLNAITWQVADKGLDDVSLMSSSLGRFFRLSLSKGAEVISLADEVEHVRSYLNIQGIRYQDKLNYRISIPKEYLSFPILKLILQPLVENSIYHGIKAKKNGGRIEVTASEERKEEQEILRLYVWDDGAGIPAEKLEQINEGLRTAKRKTSDGYGIYNVNERIMLYYGNGYGLSYESEEGVYTRATVTVPINQGEEEE